MPLKQKAAHGKDIRTADNGVQLQHRHFAFIANVIKGMIGEDFEGLRPVIAKRFADACEQTNPKFDRARFFATCTEL